MRFSGSSSGSDSFCLVDDDYSVRSNARCPIKVKIHNENGKCSVEDTARRNVQALNDFGVVQASCTVV